MDKIIDILWLILEETTWCAPAHNNLLSTGRETDWASHNIEHELSGIYDVTHGAGLAVIFPAWMKFVYKHDLDRFNQFATRVFDVKVEGKTKGEIALEGIKKLEEFFKSINLPVTLKELEIGEDRLEDYKYNKDENDFIIEINNVNTFKQITINCKGQDIEIETNRIINKDIDDIISDLKIETSLKSEVAKIMFSDDDIKKKRINIRKLKRKGLHPRYINMFLKLLEYIEENV